MKSYWITYSSQDLTRRIKADGFSIEEVGSQAITKFWHGGVCIAAYTNLTEICEVDE